jgi:hypothetical protein
MRLFVGGARLSISGAGPRLSAGPRLPFRCGEQKNSMVVGVRYLQPLDFKL